MRRLMLENERKFVRRIWKSFKIGICNSRKNSYDKAELSQSFNKNSFNSDIELNLGLEGKSMNKNGNGEKVLLQPKKIFFVILLQILASFLNWIALAYIHDLSGRTALPDIIFSFIPEIRWALKIGDFMVTICLSSIIFLFIFHKHRIILIQRILFIVSSLYIMRALSLICTQLPSGYYDNYSSCQSQISPEERTLEIFIKRVMGQAIAIGFQDNETKMLCGDMLFSGHSLIMMTGVLSVSYYSPNKYKFIKYIVGLCAIIGMISMIISRVHYTVDVLFAYWLTTGLFTLYHSYCEIETYRERKNSVIGKLWISKIIGWLEENIPSGNINNEFEIPFIKKYNKTSHSKNSLAAEKYGKINTDSTSKTSSSSIMKEV
ncbi:Phosphatidic acid phosphatase type 2/haloperoxidase domain and Sphingomyelin synthase-like domain-containing protein [Strongyloides ratti]|uniref:Phosphatidic acid phosphatase type 2/haloperoxidase domain and Sphingomyelin synthase-like domain-containing protein n=1 Tax=Strongyloides ratti TaxID=34506 RepID=A0A090LD85_STRRB|nr:Phosphatidic acid phosphatase type 2/haloperoxidase domain and Sphingomyelin synthase-like domain-containing protein [Strongyloides ratti]CEF65490.1 Phosphatidic acid phosphatase type 2/haloperoxidase domain and Sphingomyelin synthase-like domain-containing protein [Strongyloides ratti]